MVEKHTCLSERARGLPMLGFCAQLWRCAKSHPKGACHVVKLGSLHIVHQSQLCYSGEAWTFVHQGKLSYSSI